MPAIASEGIHEMAVTEDSRRVIANGVALLRMVRRMMADGSAPVETQRGSTARQVHQRRSRAITIRA